MKTRLAVVALVLATAAACSRDVTGPQTPPERSVQGATTFSPDSTPPQVDGGTMMGSGSRSTP